MHEHPATDPAEATPERRRSPLRSMLAVAIALTGLVWMLQGQGVLTAGRSFMVGDPMWTVIGAAFLVLGIGLAIRARRRPA